MFMASAMESFNGLHRYLKSLRGTSNEESSLKTLRLAWIAIVLRATIFAECRSKEKR